MCYAQNLRRAGFAYLGNVSQSMKLRLSKEHGTLTYGIYLAPADMSGYEVCPVSRYCRDYCLDGSGQNKVQLLAGVNQIRRARIAKTRLFFEDRQLFMELLVAELTRWQRYARRRHIGFAVRLNCTSDLSPEEFTIGGSNILQLFPEVQFYDYTKVTARLALLGKYPNYDLTFSYNGHNAAVAEQFLRRGGRVAVVFADAQLPSYFMGYPVCDGNAYDMRFLDPAGIIGLHYHPVANDYKDGIFTPPDTPFVIRHDDPRSVFA